MNPFGRYFAPRWQRAGRIFSTVIPGIPLIVVTSYSHVSEWLIGPLIAIFALGIIAAIAECFIPFTTIDQQGVRRRRPNSTGRIGWDEIFDAKLTSTWGTSYVLLLLWSGKQVPLYGVPEGAIEGIRRMAAENPAHPAHVHPSGPMASRIQPG